MACSKNVAIFFSGVAAVEILNHTYLAMSNLLPLDFVLHISRMTNYIILGVWIFIFAFSAYYAWMKK